MGSLCAWMIVLGMILDILQCVLLITCVDGNTVQSSQAPAPRVRISCRQVELKVNIYVNTNRFQWLVYIISPYVYDARHFSINAQDKCRLCKESRYRNEKNSSITTHYSLLPQLGPLPVPLLNKKALLSIISC